MFYLFTTSACPNCPRAKEVLASSKLNYSLIDASTTDGLNLARRFSVASVPTLLEVNEQQEALNQWAGIDAILSYQEIACS
ncbi:MAG: glutaredoxin domain-containing protein [bacterium]|nr:glutaredoxin domain-containing protein [bacterium]